MSIVYGVLVLCALGKIGAKAEIHVYFEDISITGLDDTYIDEEVTEVWITDDNTITTNLTIKKRLPADCEGHFKLTGLSMGKYKMSTGIDISMALCDLLAEPIIIGPFFAVLGFTSDDCPPSPGVYFHENYTLPMENLPDDFPENKYMATFEVALNKKPLLQFEFYVDVQI